jgi:predicted nucleic acid-binding OB-fold protein
MKKQISISCGHCACGDYESENLKATSSCRKSGSSPDSSLGVAHLIRYELLTDKGRDELGHLIEDMFGYGADYIRVEQVE